MIEIFNRYELVKELGKGATSHVYLAWDKLLSRKTAVKTGYNEELFLREARCLSEYVKPCFPVLYDYAKEENCAYLFMEYVEGENLKERFARTGGYTEKEVIYIACQAAQAIQFLHTGKTPYVYGDIKLENIMVQKDGSVKLVDFGTLCPLAEPVGGSVLRGGTPRYAPPDMWMGHADIRSDIYALGKLMLFLIQISGRKSMGANAERIIERCTQKQKEARYQSMEQVISALNACLAEPS